MAFSQTGSPWQRPHVLWTVTVVIASDQYLPKRSAWACMGKHGHTTPTAMWRVNSKLMFVAYNLF